MGSVPTRSQGRWPIGMAGAHLVKAALMALLAGLSCMLYGCSDKDGMVDKDMVDKDKDKDGMSCDQDGTVDCIAGVTGTDCAALQKTMDCYAGCCKEDGVAELLSG